MVQSFRIAETLINRNRPRIKKKSILNRIL
jgi:hypothetical protein